MRDLSEYSCNSPRLKCVYHILPQLITMVIVVVFFVCFFGGVFTSHDLVFSFTGLPSMCLGHMGH